MRVNSGSVARQAGLTIALVGALAAGSLQAQEDAPKARAILKNLSNPSGVAIRPKSNHVYVAHSNGVTRFIGGKNRSVTTVIGGYENDIYGKGPKYNIGPLGLAFLDKDHLVVGDGSRKDGEELVRVYHVTDSEQKESDAVMTLGPITAGEQSVRGEGNFYGIAVHDAGIYVTCNGDDTKGWVSRAALKNGKPSELTPFIATKEAVEVDAPVGITIGPDGDLVISQMGEMNVPGDSLLTIYDATTGKLKKSYATGLSDIAGVAYSPKTGNLYAVDFSWSATEKGGLFRLTIDGDECKAEKIMSLDKPSSLAFSKNGSLFITVFGTASEESEKPAGALMRVAPGL